MLRKNYKVLIVDCIYKTNKFKLPLCTVQGITAMKSTFIASYPFILSEKDRDYAWVMMQQKLLHNQLLIPDPGLFITDAEQALANGISSVFPNAAYILCVFHIDNNMKTQACRSMCFQPEIDEFMKMWKAVHQQDTLEKLDKKWGALQDKFQQDPELLDYCWNTWLDKRAEKFYRCYTNELLNFGITISSSLEGAHARLKDRLPLSTGDLGGVVEQTDGLVRY